MMSANNERKTASDTALLLSPDHDDNDDDSTNRTSMSMHKSAHAVAGASPSTSLAFKCYVICAMTFLWTGYTLLVRHTRSTIAKEKVRPNKQHRLNAR